MSKPRDDSSEVGELLRTARHRLGLTQANFALALGISLSTYGRWERGQVLARFKYSVIRRFDRLSPDVFNAFMGDLPGPVPLRLVPPPDLPFGEATQDDDESLSSLSSWNRRQSG